MDLLLELGGTHKCETTEQLQCIDEAILVGIPDNERRLVSSEDLLKLCQIYRQVITHTFKRSIEFPQPRDRDYLFASLLSSKGQFSFCFSFAWILARLPPILSIQKVCPRYLSGVWGLGFGVWGLGFGVWEIGRAHV